MNSISILRRLALIATILLVTLAAAGLARNARAWLLPPGSTEGPGLEAAASSRLGGSEIGSSIAPGAVDGSALSP